MAKSILDKLNIASAMITVSAGLVGTVGLTELVGYAYSNKPISLERQEYIEMCVNCGAYVGLSGLAGVITTRYLINKRDKKSLWNII